ncbi:ATP-dependent Clp protease ATP-binding subunit [bacterium]|nr:ATP-dependent Clp protease ATP-binding subunit [bacterium]
MPPRKKTDAPVEPPKAPARGGRKAPLLEPATSKDVAAESRRRGKALSATAGGESDYPVEVSRDGSSGAGQRPPLITEVEATIPVVIPSGARSPVDDIVEVLKKEVIGQDRAISAISRALLRAREGFRTPGRPISVMFFAGPTGVGKTETVRALAKALHDDYRAVLKIDCSEYSEPHAIARLIGAPPGYVGSDLPAVFQRENVEGVKNRVILFDEVEKGHYRLHNLLLQIMDEGRITLARRTKEDDGSVSFEDCIVIMTSNIGAFDIDNILHASRIGFRNEPPAATAAQTDYQIYTAAKEAMKRMFSPEFRNRLTEFIVFRALSRHSLYDILQKLLNISAARFAGMGFHLKLSSAARDWLVDRGIDQELGVRPLVRAVEKYIDTKVAELHAYGLIREGDMLEAVVEEVEPYPDGRPRREIKFMRAPRLEELEPGAKAPRRRKVTKTEIVVERY